MEELYDIATDVVCPCCLSKIDGIIHEAPIRHKVLCNDKYGQHITAHGRSYFLVKACLPDEI